MEWPEPPEGYELMGEFVEIDVRATIVGTKFSINFKVCGEVEPGSRAQDNEDLIAAVGAAMMVVWESAWERHKGTTLSLQYQCLRRLCVLTADTVDLPIEAVANAARELVQEG
jgi:hypothetical protein